jgi:hypothetical protein
MSVVSVRSGEGKGERGERSVNERTEALVFSFVATRVFSEVGRRAGRGWARAAALEARTPVNPPSLTGRRPDASATSLRLVEWSLGSGRERRFGVGTRRRARTRVACFSRSVGTARRGLATARRRRKGARRGGASAQTRCAYPSHRSDSLGSASSTSESEDSSESDSALAVGDLARAGTPSAALISLGSKPRGASARGGCAHERAPAFPRRRANASFRSVSRWTRAPPSRAPSSNAERSECLLQFKAQASRSADQAFAKKRTFRVFAHRRGLRVSRAIAPAIVMDSCGSP